MIALIAARRIARAGDLALAPWLSLCEGRKVNHPLRMQQSPAAQCFSRCRAPPWLQCIYNPFIATLKPPFKLDRP
jgi:hypothetical protein